jgi:hypothetical protein
MSVAIACHNNSDHVAAAIRSALSQQPPPVELVVCDDGSTDGTRQVLEGFGDRIRVIRHAVNRGEGAAKNTAIKAASSAFVVVLDADDEFLPGRLAAIGAAMVDNPDADIVTTDAQLVHNGKVIGHWYGPTHPVPGDDQRLAVLTRNPVFGHPAIRLAAFLRVGGFDEDVRHATDWECWIRMVLSGSTLVVIDRPLAIYRIHSRSSSADRVGMLSSEVDFLTHAAARDDLTDAERAAARAAVTHRRRILARERLKAALTSSDRTSVRKQAATVARDPDQPPRSRLVARVVMAFPSSAAAAHRMQERLWWTGPGGVRLRRTSP